MQTERNEKIAVVGLGYVGLPLAVYLAEAGWEVFGYDVIEKKVDELSRGIESMGELDGRRLLLPNLHFSSDPKVLESASFIIVTVPTPIDRAKRPDLRLIENATQTIGEHLRPGAIIVYESTVYPGVTEEIALPILQKASGLEYKKDFFIGYSPERINPGDTEHTIDKVIKIISADTSESLSRVEKVYGSICKAGLHKASSIKVAEAAKVIENTQRDLNIALMNELSLIFSRIGINTREVIDAAGTKWNFHKYFPGLVGGHCYSGEHSITLLNGHEHKVRTLASYFQELQEKKIVRSEILGSTTCLYPKEDIQVLSFDKDKGKGVFAPVTCFSYREIEHGFRITTAGNHTLEVSSKHPMIVDEAGKWFVKHADNLQPGDRIPLLQSFPERSNLRTEVDFLEHMPESWHSRYRVKRKNGTWRELKDVLAVKKYTGKKASNFYHLDYLPLTLFLALEKKGVMPISREEVMLVSGRGGGSFQMIPAVVKLNENFARLVGYYLSEGCITHEKKSTRVRFTFNRDEQQTIADCISLIQKLGIMRYSQYDDRQYHATTLKVSSELFAYLLEKILQCGVRSEDARIPEELLYGTDTIRFNLLTGLLRGDGGVDWQYSHRPYQKNGKTYEHARNIANVSYFSSSPELFHGVQLLLMSFQIPFTLERSRPLLEVQGAENIQRLRECFLDTKRKKLEQYFSHKQKAPRSKIFVRHNGYVTVSVQKIEEVKLKEAYSVEVEGTHTVVTDGGFITHNCIGVDPYYLVHKAEELGYHPEVITAGRRINDWMPEYVADLMIRGLVEAGKTIHGAEVLVMGLTFKEDVRDMRNSKIKDAIKKLVSYGVNVIGYDPNLSKEETESFGVEYAPDLKNLHIDGVLLAALHKEFKALQAQDIMKFYNGNGSGVFIDIKSWFLGSFPETEPGIIYKTL